MANTGKNSPLGINVIGDYLTNNGLTINPVATSYMGASKRNAVYTFGTCVSETCLRMLTLAINDAYNRGVVLKTPAGSSVYDNLISIGSATIPALGNSKPPTYVPVDPANVWARSTVSATALSMAEQYGYQKGFTNCLPGPATSGYGNYDGSYGDPLQGDGVTDQKQNATWYPYNMTNPNHSITQWGWIRCHALQAWNEFNWNGTVVDPTSASLPSYLEGYTVPEYNEFSNTVTTAEGYAQYANQSIIATHNSNTFLDGTFSNMNDLLSADITGVSLSTVAFGTDLENLGFAISLTNLDSFGLPSNLLYTLAEQGAVTQDLSLVLLASGLTGPEISDITSGAVSNITEDQERKIYGAFLMMAGENLKSIIAPIQCRTAGLSTLADLLDVRKLFPNSYASLTVPMYNAEEGPTNSKTYYLLYTDGGLNSALDSEAMKEYVGTLVPAGNPPIYETSTTPKNYRSVPTGFDSYLTGIIPKDQAIAAGAFSFTMRQIRNVENFDIKQFAKVVKGIENVSDLPLTAGSSKPTNQDMIDQCENVGALGSGPYGSYTMSDFFGSMSGLPYSWQLIKQRINDLETTKLYNIYNQLFLAATWDGASITVVPESREVEISPGVFQTEYRVGSLTVADPGGGYGRGNAADPVITCSNGGQGVGIVGRNDAEAGSSGNGNFGRITSTTLTNQGAWQLTPPTAAIQYPPTQGLPITTSGTIASGGTNTSAGTTGWAQPMNQVVSAYIGQANDEIASILNAKPAIVNYLTQYWNMLGTQLIIEQRTRYKAIVPVSVPKDMFSNPYPTSIYSLVDSSPQLAQDTRPHMAAQTIEAISDMSNVGGQSTVGMMRQERNQARLQLLGIEQDNNIPSELSDEEIKQVTTNGTLPGAKDGINGYTNPAWPANEFGNDIKTPVPTGVYIPPNLSNTADLDELPGFQPKATTAPGDITSILENSPVPVVAPIVATGPTVSLINPSDFPIIIQPAPAYDPTNLPPNLDPNYISSTLMPSVPSVQEAIDRVIECNCDCWVS
jgi:hypothetical protein